MMVRTIDASQIVVDSGEYCGEWSIATADHEEQLVNSGYWVVHTWWILRYSPVWTSTDSWLLNTWLKLVICSDAYSLKSLNMLNTWWIRSHWKWPCSHERSYSRDEPPSMMVYTGRWWSHARWRKRWCVLWRGRWGTSVVEKLLEITTSIDLHRIIQCTDQTDAYINHTRPTYYMRA